MSVCLLVSANTIEGTASWRTYLTPDGMLIEYSIHFQAKHNCSSSFLKFADFIDKDSITMLFLQSLSISRKQLQKYYFFSN